LRPQRLRCCSGLSGQKGGRTGSVDMERGSGGWGLTMVGLKVDGSNGGISVLLRGIRGGSMCRVTGSVLSADITL
jgi:hypothetical protein